MAGKTPGTEAYIQKRKRRHPGLVDVLEQANRSTWVGGIEEVQEEENQEQKSFQKQTERLLACPCLDDLKQGPCGDSFKDAFKCFILSKEAEKGAECAQQFTNLEACMMQHQKDMFKKAEDRQIPKLVLQIPPVPGKSLVFDREFANWTKQTKDENTKGDKKKEDKKEN